jgi:hypothetical protein
MGRYSVLNVDVYFAIVLKIKGDTLPQPRGYHSSGKNT